MGFYNAFCKRQPYAVAFDLLVLGAIKHFENLFNFFSLYADTFILYNKLKLAGILGYGCPDSAAPVGILNGIGNQIVPYPKQLDPVTGKAAFRNQQAALKAPFGILYQPFCIVKQQM